MCVGKLGDDKGCMHAGSRWSDHSSNGSSNGHQPTHAREVTSKARPPSPHAVRVYALSPSLWGVVMVVDDGRHHARSDSMDRGVDPNDGVLVIEAPIKHKIEIVPCGGQFTLPNIDCFESISIDVHPHKRTTR